MNNYVKDIEEVPVLVEQNRFELLLQAGGLNLYPVLFDKGYKVNITGWLIFTQLGYLKHNMLKNKLSGKFNRPGVEALSERHITWACTNTITDNIKVLEEKQLIKVSRRTGCKNSYELTEVGKDLYLTKCIKEKARFIRVYPPLAKQIGLIESIILVRLHNASYKKELTRSVENMHKTFFKGVFSLSTFTRGIAALKKLNLLDSFKQIDDEDDTTAVNTYEINYLLLKQKYFKDKANVIHDNKTLGMVYEPKPY